MPSGRGGKCLADANDFKYMRTIFPLADDKEDGFVFLSDAFIRQLSSPTSRIKEKRRLETLTSLYIGPANAGEAASLFLEYEGHNLALLNNQVWNCFYQTGLLTPQGAEAARRETVRRFLGFVPVSPDGSTYRYDAQSGEVVNRRHGSFRRPDLHSRLAEASELGQFLKQIKALRAELRFLENGLHTLLTIELGATGPYRHPPRPRHPPRSALMTEGPIVPDGTGTNAGGKRKRTNRVSFSCRVRYR